MSKKTSVVLLAACAFIAAVLLSGLAFLFADDAVPHADTAELTSANTGAYYDEIWQATRIFRTRRKSADDPHQAVYEAKAANDGNFTTGSDPTVTIGNATLPQHTVVTQWEVSGHVHFPN